MASNLAVLYLRWTAIMDSLRRVFVTTLELPGMPAPLRWQVSPDQAEVTGDVLQVRAGVKTDLFTDPLGSPGVANAPWAGFSPQGDFMFSAKVTVEFAATFDAGVLVVYQHPKSWAKLCFEYAPGAYPSVVSVVTKGYSDDCNSLFVDSRETYLRVSRIGPAFAFHHATDAERWHLIRVFRLEPTAQTQVGLLAQSPTGQGCQVRFSEVRFTPRTLGDIRSGD